MSNRLQSRRYQQLFRLYPDQIERLKAKIVVDKITFQKLMELLIKLYLNNYKTIMDHVEKYKDEKYARKRRHNSLNEEEADMLLRKIENASPMSEMNNILDELENEIDQKL